MFQLNSWWRKKLVGTFYGEHSEQIRLCKTVKLADNCPGSLRDSQGQAHCSLKGNVPWWRECFSQWHSSWLRNLIHITKAHFWRQEAQVQGNVLVKLKNMSELASIRNIPRDTTRFMTAESRSDSWIKFRSSPCSWMFLERQAWWDKMFL